MAKRKKPKAKLKSVTIKLPWIVQAEWESDDREVKVLRDLVDQIRTRRAFEIGRGMLLEQPSYFLLSIVEMRDATRKLLERLPVKATQSRLILLTVMDWLAEILDEWHRAQKNVNPRAWNFQQLDMSDMRRVMKDCWSVVEKARVHLSQLRSDLESQLKL